MVAPAETWLLLIHQLPAQPAYLRVKLWRRLRALGAVAIKNAVHALPANRETHEDLAWLAKEIVAGGGEAIICEAKLIEGLSDEALRQLFNQARDEDYAELTQEARTLTARRETETDGESAAPTGKLANRIEQIAAIDFFGADGRVAAERSLAGLSEMAPTPSSSPPKSASPSKPARARAASTAEATDYLGKIWLTRQDLHVDRLACAWLIRRFIDPQARFQFVAGLSHPPSEGVIRFDMSEAEITHEGDRCSFEVLLARIGRRDPALAAIAEIIHDLDLKDGKFARSEAPGVKIAIEGLARQHPQDEARLAAAAALFDALYAAL